MRIFSALSGVAAIALATAGPVWPLAEAKAQTPFESVRTSGQELPDFYAARAGNPLWFGQDGRQIELLLRTLSSARVDGLDPSRYRVELLERAARRASESRDRRSIGRADVMLSQAFVEYVRDLRNASSTSTIYVDPELRPVAPSPFAILEKAARAPSLEQHVASFGWMHPLYGQLRNALASGAYGPGQQDRLRVNLERARELPAGPGRYVLVNAAAQRLFMVENGRAVGSMRVVVGRPRHPTPMMAAYIRFANLNPYWYVPADLAAERIAPNVVKQGLGYLDRQGYQVVSDFVDNPKIFDASVIDWRAVVNGRQRVLLRQQPGPANAMGRIKFMFPNEQGIYLHDNPERELFEQAARLYSGGCVRLEDAWRLSRWLFGRELDWKGAGTEQKVSLPAPVPVYLTYLTAVPGESGSGIAFLDDVYGRDKVRVAGREEVQPAAASR